MKSSSLKFILVAAGLVVMLSLPTLVMAAISGPFVTTTPIPASLTDWTSSLAFPKFNSALGTLTMVQLDLSGSLSTIITVTNNSGEPSSGTAKTECQMTVQDAGNNLIVPEIDLFSPNYSYSLGAGGSTTSGILTKSGTSSDLYTTAAVLAEFNGPGVIVLPASTFTITWLTNTGGNTFASQVTLAQLTGTVTYTYSTVPEPGSFLALGSGLVGLVGFAIRRRK